MNTLLLIGGVLLMLGCLVALAVCGFALARNEVVYRYQLRVLDHVHRVNIAAIEAGTYDRQLSYEPLDEARANWDKMIFRPWKPLAEWFPPEYRP